MSSNEYSTENVGCRNEKSGKSPSQAAECDVGLALNMLNPETTHPKKMNFIFDPSFYHHSQHRTSIEFSGGSGGGGRLVFDNSLATSSHIVSGTSFSNPTGGKSKTLLSDHFLSLLDDHGIDVTSGSEMQKMLFTASQLQEFENQTMIYKHIMSSNPIPPQMLLPLSTQYNRSDSEPWRCRRTDGKKWRCSRDVMRDQKYCERHAHKNRPRSRKPVETQSLNTKNLNNKDNYHSLLPPTPSMPTSCQESRCTEWFMKGGTIPLSSSQQKIQKPMPSPSFGSKSDHLFQNLQGNHQALVDVDNCSLSLMQPGGDYACVDQDFFQMGIGMLNADGSNPQSQLMPHGSWLGGPLGEALCPGVVSSRSQPTNVTSPNDSSHGLC